MWAVLRNSVIKLVKIVNMLRFILLIFALQSVFALETSRPCHAKQAEFGVVCNCNETYCDTLDVPLPEVENSYILIASSQSGDRFSYTEGEFSKSSSSNVRNAVNLTISSITSQRKIIGFGGAFTGTVSFLLDKFSPKLRAHFYNSYYSADSGIGYNMMRVPMGGSDFDTEMWVYDLNPKNDTMPYIDHKLDPRDKLRNKQIKELKDVSGIDDIKIVTAAWNAAPWLRAMHTWHGYPDNQILPKYYQTWADFHAGWLNLMKADGVPLWGLSPGNEPAIMQLASFPTLSWNGTNQGEWLVKYLIPTLKRTTNGHLKILGVDDQRYTALEWLSEMNGGNSKAIDNIDIVAIHAYFDNASSSNVLDDIHNLYDKPILYTEMSFGVRAKKRILLGSWTRAESLIEILMDIFSHDAVGYIDWNLILNSTGGPCLNHNELDAFILANEDFTAFIKQPLFYAMAHFAKYLLPESHRIETNIAGADESYIRSVAYLRPDNLIAVVLYNNHTEKAINLNVFNDLNGITSLLLEAKSLKTLIYSRK